MRPTIIAVLAAFALTGCQKAQQPVPPSDPAASPAASGGAWTSKVGGAGVSIELADDHGAPVLTLACGRDPAEFMVTVHGLKPVASEERLMFGVDGKPFVLVATPSAQSQGVQAKGRIDEALLAEIAAGKTFQTAYGAQTTGPHPAPDGATSGDFIAACRQITSAPPPA